ncbi:OmpP1/FadL family transporter [Sagittula salina]|uniref:Outer membrane protein transport protein n=1 Tax=Sagittula salina TaxID=2820268 RepID=A0A940RZI7_9RHOB|nr:outer membrane protein transport protein [Sagittula salina]MBP0482028.1 outer membrane protein transport protein [Sagittula salina]
MKKFTTGAALLALSSTTAMAAGLDRSGQSVSAIFAPSGTTTLSYGVVMPQVTGRDIGAGGSYENVGETYGQGSIAHTHQINDSANFALIIDQPYGADINYATAPTASRLGGTGADFNSLALTAVARYKVTDRISVFGGVSAQRLDSTVNLNGFAYQQGIVLGGVAAGIPGIDAQTVGAAVSCTPQAAAAGIACSPAQPLAAAAIDGATGGNSATVIGQAAAGLAGFALTGGYRFRMNQTTEPHYLIGAAYEIPAIALRVAGTYHFETRHTAKTVENVLGATTNGTVEFVTPQSFNLEAQTGIAKGTLLTASWRWTEFSAVDLVPDRLGRDLVNLDDSNRYTLGLARQFSDKLALSTTVSYEPEGDELVSPLGPTNGLVGLSLGGRWTDGPLNISGGVNYSWLGDAKPEVGGNAQANFTDNHAVGVGFKVDMKF